MPPPKPSSEKLTLQAQTYLAAGGQFPHGKLANGLSKKAKAIRTITKAVSENDIEFWRHVVEAYCTIWSLKSYTCMLDWYSRGEIPGKSKFNGNGYSGNSTSPPSHSGVVAIMASIRKTREENREIRKCIQAVSNG